MSIPSMATSRVNKQSIVGGDEFIPRVPARKRKGRCYELALRGALLDGASNWRVVHGEVLMADGETRMGHAWLQAEERVYDPVLDRCFSWSAYSARYKAVAFGSWAPQEMAAQVDIEGNYGPWAGPYVGTTITSRS